MSDRRREAVTDRRGAVGDAVRNALDAVSRPEYTGENRCLPCTAVNAVGVAAVAILIGHHRRAFGGLAALAGAAAIWLRGYVVPGTPRFAPRFVAPLPVDFGAAHRTEADSGSLAADHEEDGDIDPEAVMERLVAVDALVVNGETLRLAEPFRTALDDRLGEMRAVDETEVAERAAAVAGAGVAGEVHDGRVLLDGRRDAWLSRPVALAETAFAELLREREVDEAVAREAARPLRAFLETCPVCDGPVRETTLRNCCGGPGGVSGDPERSVRACADCDAVVFTER
ncbi:hypothetical protein EKH57_05900 [Halorubrum sp. BOL3-1]|uniref:hypothetical protein n=1 Tax=Halorubrum sp. BOL3-1 TaxID=2497325 RepID=UPI0010050330|nr:hypothetical protein [Halorubrum sp. BOL3-1]QAU12287.1 hypothetical protein EKH57_05900 [Halorubrum sp. BOL3-1]